MSTYWIGTRARATSWSGAGAIAAFILAAACGIAEDADQSSSSDTPDGGAGGGSGGMAGSGGTGGSGGMGGSGGGPDGMAGSDGGTLGGFSATPTAYAVHASHDLFPFRLCAEVDGEVVTKYPYPFDADHHLPETSYPGIAVGGIVDLAPLLDDIEPNATVTLHAMRALQLNVANAVPEIDIGDCYELLYGYAKLAPSDIRTFSAVSLGDPTVSPIRLLIFDGCGPSDPPVLSQTQCGPSYDPATGNLNAHVTGFSPFEPMEPATTLVYPMHLSPSLAELQPEHSLALSYGELKSTTGRQSIADDVPEDAPSMTHAELTAPAVMGEYGTTGFKLSAIKVDGEQTLMEASLASIQRVSAPYETPQAFFTSANGLLMLFVGDASTQSETWLDGDGAWNPAYDGRGLHVLAIPFEFVYGS